MSIKKNALIIIIQAIINLLKTIVDNVQTEIEVE